MSTCQQKGEQVNKTNNDLQKILTHAIEEIRNEMGTDFDINKINLKDLENRMLFPVKTISNSIKSDHQIQSKPIKSRQYVIT